MTLRSAESRGKKCLNQFPRESVTDHEAAETDQVEIVVLDALVRGKCFVNQTRADADNLIRRDRCSNSASANRNPSLHVSTGNSASQRHDIIRIIIVELRVSVSKINYFMTSVPQSLGQIVLQLEAAVVSGYANEFRGAHGNRCWGCSFHFRLPAGDTGGRKREREPWSSAA